MRALLSVEKGGPERLVLVEDAPLPSPGPGEVRIRVRASSLNYPDLLLIEDRYQHRPPRPFAPGSEVAGTIDALGEGVTGWEPGQRVMAMTGWGGLADYVCAPVAKLAALPEEMSFAEGAALLVTYGTTWHALTRRAGLQPGETLLVLGAAGGVGLAAVELGRALGARVIAAASTPEKLALAREAGAAGGVLYPPGPMTGAEQKAITAAFKDACGAEGADVIYDPVGGPYAEAAFRAIGWGGRHLVIGFTAGIASLPMNLPLLKGASVVGVFWGEALERDPAGYRATVAELTALHAKGRLRPRIHATWPLEQGAEALAALAARQAMGKLVVTI